jgi:hypothetical protein
MRCRVLTIDSPSAWTLAEIGRHGHGWDRARINFHGSIDADLGTIEATDAERCGKGAEWQ